MPTKSELLSPLCVGGNIFGNSCPMLSMRPFSPDTDMSIIYTWLSEDCAGHTGLLHQEPELLEEAYSSIVASDAAQVFIGMVDDSPVCEIDICKVKQHAISLAYDPRPGDYYVDLLPTPCTAQEYMSELLNNALEYFFSFGEVNRIMAEADVKNHGMNELLKSAGFRLYKRVSLTYRNSNLHFCTQRSMTL